MEIKIIEDKKQSLYAYKNDQLLFYSTIKFNWLRKNLVRIFDSNDQLVLELQISETPFGSAKFKILFQNKGLIKDVTEITKTNILFDGNKKIRKTSENLFSFNLKSSYFLEKSKIADVEGKFWTTTQKFYIDFDSEYEEFLNLVIIHILATRTGYNSNSV
ncbi:hypothetical protein [Flavobacterium branchiicola]|uniref:Uncharacterized protein n=1 Tax=Flavobacterium branchiicola TaxID=1114875 RepID=A0ABV9PDR2_9FLAO|nr:hypothetical protein [Flavobacterium branchiicola]MBS7253905.1 hypothetical protein [Flavobacterium branchiicola]